ncbi:type VI secretion system tube protein TssD [Aquimarina sp. SS2-1]|uniref:type VI secretion system tube protein TssD n=1 Tax=Aquimarina besae TaxID=3342247 RepID=UPI00366FBB9E
MAFQAKLFINDQERNVLDGTFLYQQLIDHNGRPKTTIHGGGITLLIESTKDDELFYDWMFSTHTMYNGYVRFYKRDGYSKLFDFEFANCHCIHLEEKFNAEGNSPLKMELVLSPGIQRVRDVLFEKNWNPSNPFTEAAPITEREEEKEPDPPKITEMKWIDDDEATEIKETNNLKKVFLYAKVKNIEEGEEVKITLEDGDGDSSNNVVLRGIVNENGEVILKE